MARPYRDAAELVCRRAPKDPNGFVQETAWVVIGIAFPGSLEPLPIILDSRFEYRIRHFTGPQRSPGWALERRAVHTRAEGPDPD
jgi:hypothetical protein